MELQLSETSYRWGECCKWSVLAQSQDTIILLVRIAPQVSVVAGWSWRWGVRVLVCC